MKSPGPHRSLSSGASSALRSAFAHSGAAVEFRDRAAKNASVLDDLVRKDGDPDRRILFRNTTIITGKADQSVLRGNVLVIGSKIADVGPAAGTGADGTNAVVIDASDSILMPGFVDSHLHAWEGQLRGMSPDADFDHYLEVAHKTLGTLFRPHDTYIGNLVSSLVSLYSGVTTIVDNSHNSRTADHSSAAVEALFDSGIRGVHAAAAPRFGAWDQQWPADLDRLQSEYFSSPDQLVTLRMMDTTADAEAWRFAHERGLWVSSEIGSDWVDNIPELHRLGLVTETHTFNHCLGLSEAEWQIIADTGVKVNVSPRSDTLFGLGPSFPAIDEALAHGIRPGLSMDNELSYGVDMFTEMSVLTHLQRGRVHQRRYAEEDNVPAPITAGDAIEFATLRGAENAGLIDRTGSIEAGKEADLILIDTTAPNTIPATDPVATVVAYAHPGNVSAVFVGGEVRKWDGHLVGVDMHTVRAVAEQSRDWLLAESRKN
ncbi:amidohydrolase family protein [Streptomyces sp. AK02-01A]|uniref:amidohydrolase family protein n=1 Tax=Streptomyces sp. AK02-01A TaxID=3028648 RepID=UPI0029B5D47E|nr:amidohydrolase family protein [Streptomyces sp. AK02-01A]MDX3852368.1 amidohydrolase family protein [Streptomyces sp. AK02-01A]